MDDPLTAAKLLCTFILLSPGLHTDIAGTASADAQAQLGMPTGALIAVPIPEEHEAVGLEIQEFVNQAVRESEQNGISQTGNDATPWLLNRVYELSQGRSLQSNIALLRSTARVGTSACLVHDLLHKILMMYSLI
jgi:pseudouridine-5'-phosphate glycosidase